MKKIAYLKTASYLLLLLIMLYACAGTKDSRRDKRNIKGQWLLKTVSTEAVPAKFSATAFNEADYNCFIGSTWSLSSGGKGSYILDGMSKGCPGKKRLISWNVIPLRDSMSMFELKRLDSNKSAMDANYSWLEIIKVDGKTMQLRSNISHDDHAAAIIYNFEKR